ncbi:MAG: NUDIX domain-containing protein, partial [Bosea sp. (in: a-proteobacteria)]
MAETTATNRLRQRPHLASYCLLRVGETILLQRRFNTGYLDGCWGAPSGHVDEGEDALSAASRELREETGLIVEPSAWRFVCAKHRRTSLTIIDLFFTAEDVQGGRAPHLRARHMRRPRLFPNRPPASAAGGLCRRGDRLPPGMGDAIRPLPPGRLGIGAPVSACLFAPRNARPRPRTPQLRSA